MLTDTITAVATPLSPSGIGIIRISGDQAISIADCIFEAKNRTKRLIHVPSHTLHYGFIVDPFDQSFVDEVLVSVMKGPNSFTKEDVVEINAHGGIVVIQKILKIILNQGARLADPGEFTKRAFLNGRIDLSQAEAVMDLINANSDMALNASINQLKGSVSEKIIEIKSLTIQLIAHIEASIDYPEYDIEQLEEDQIEVQMDVIKDKILILLNSYDDGKRIREGIKTVIVGKPNVGKSSLLNFMLKEQRAIVTEIPGTTRDVLEEYMNLHGIPLKIMDTAGIRKTDDVVEKIGVQKSKEKISEADLVLFMMDASTILEQEDFEIIELIQDKKVIVLLNKTDLEPQITIEEISNYFTDMAIFPISVKDNMGLEALESQIKKMFLIGQINFNEHVYITNVRHKNALEHALSSIEEVRNSIEAGMAVDFLAIDLKNVYEAIGEITGDSVQEDLVHQIFSQFCLGK